MNGPVSHPAMENMGDRPHLSPGLVADDLRGCLQLLQGSHRQLHHRPQEVHRVVESRKGLWETDCAVILRQDARCLMPLPPPPQPSTQTHYEVPSHRGLEDPVEGALGKGAGGEVEEPRDQVTAEGRAAGPRDSDKGTAIEGRRTLAHSAW